MSGVALEMPQRRPSVHVYLMWWCGGCGARSSGNGRAMAYEG
jgi:hypothetical protein